MSKWTQVVIIFLSMPSLLGILFGATCINIPKKTHIVEGSNQNTDTSHELSTEGSVEEVEYDDEEEDTAAQETDEFLPRTKEISRQKVKVNEVQVIQRAHYVCVCFSQCLPSFFTVVHNYNTQLIRIVTILTFFAIYHVVVLFFPLVITTDLQVFEVFIMYTRKSILMAVFIALLIVHAIALRGQISFFSKFREENWIKMKDADVIQEKLSTSI